MVALLAIVLAIFCSPPSVSQANIPLDSKRPQPRNQEADFHYRKTAKKIVRIRPTAYYKPVPGQDNYATGSYRKEIRLNGSGITYSDKLAKIGFLAADRKYYPIGTEMFLEFNGKPIGKWIVEDIGPAIKGPKRLDLFVGEGDQGLAIAQQVDKNKDFVIAYIVKWGKKSRNS